MSDFPEEYKPVIEEIKRRGYDPLFILRLAILIREYLEKVRVEDKKTDPALPVCVGCGGVGKYQKKNGNWYCEKYLASCPGIAAKIRESHQKRRLKRKKGNKK